MSRPQLLLCLLIFVHRTRLFVGGHLFSWLLDSQTVCEPDFFQCPNGGLAFRDRNHNCDFTPCELIPDPPLPPPPPSPKTLPVHKWFGRHEFIVPTIDVAALQRGKTLERQWAKIIEAKRRDPLRRKFGLTMDVHIVTPPPTADKISMTYAANARDLHLDSLVASQAKLFDSAVSPSNTGPQTSTFSATAQMLAVSKLPWTRWEFFGQLGAATTISPSIASVETALRLLSTASSTTEDASFTSLALEGSSDSDVMAGLLQRCESVLPALVSDRSSLASVLVFSTDFRFIAMDQNKEAIGSEHQLWNLTRLQCSPTMLGAADVQRQQSLDTNSSIPTTNLDPSVHVVFPLNETNDVVVGHSNDTNCSCWTRSLVSRDEAGVDPQKNRTKQQETEWMLCQ